MAARIPRGVWPMLWTYQQIIEDIPGMVRRMLEVGATGVKVKVHDGEWSWLGHNQVREMVTACHAAGLGVIGWGYNVGNWQGPAIGFDGSDRHNCTIADEIARIGEAFAVGIDGYELDPEMEWARNAQRPDPAAHAREYLERLRSAFPSQTIGSCNIPRVGGGFPDYPLPEMIPYVDYFAPQTYVVEWGIPELVDRWTKRAMGLLLDTGVPDRLGGVPVLPTYDLAQDDGTPAAPGFLVGAAQVAIGYGAAGIGLWSWDNCRVWDQVAEASKQFAARPDARYPTNDAINPAVWHCAATDVWVVEPAFLKKWLEGGLAQHGLPVRGQDGTTQFFERSRMELQPDGSVALGRVGAELADLLDAARAAR